MAKSGRARSKARRKQPLPVVRPAVAGVDIGSRQHWVCGPGTPDAEPNVAVFGTSTPQLQQLADWLQQQGVESVAMESTYVYWIPLYELLESRGFEVLLVDARQLHKVPGRKTDMADCQWLQRLHSCGLLRGSFRPNEAICALRAIQRQMSHLVEERTRYTQWMQKALDQMNVQVHRAVTDLTGTTGMAIVRAIVDGERNPVRLAALRDKRCKKSEAQMAELLSGHWRDEHLFNLACALRLFDATQAELGRYSDQLTSQLERLQPEQRREQPMPAHPNPTKARAIRKRGEVEMQTTLWRFTGVDLTRIDGISPTTAMTIINELGPDLTAFPTEHDFVGWLRLCPRTPVSAGKPLKKRCRGMGANRVAHALRLAAVALSRSKTALGAYFRRHSRRKDGGIAVFATARRLATLVYRMLRYGQDYVDIGEQAYEARFAHRRLHALTQSAQDLGYKLVPVA